MTTYHHRPRPLADLVPALTKDVFGSKNQLFGKMLANWPHIAGEDMAALTVPIDLKIQRAPKAKDGAKTAATGKTAAGQAILHLAVQPAYALEFTYQKDLLIERLNMFFGYAAIKDIKVVQHSEVMSNKKIVPPLQRPLTAAEESQLTALTGGIQEKDLQTALKNLGKAIISRHKGT